MKALFPSSPQLLEYAMPLVAASNRDGGGTHYGVLTELTGPGFVQWQGSSRREMLLRFAGHPTKVKFDVVNSGWYNPVSFSMGGVNVTDIRGLSEVAVLGNTNSARLYSERSPGTGVWFRFNTIKGIGIS